jgi:predicted Zn-dependent protease
MTLPQTTASPNGRPHAWRRSALAWACALALLAAPPPLVQAQVNLPALGDAVSDEFSPGAERRLGEQIMRDVRRDPAYLDDPLLLDYVQSLWQPLLAAARQRGDIGAEIGPHFAWEAFLVRDRSVNAFALPGGFVGVHLGLIAMTAHRDELASVLAHELSHVTQRHIARGMSQQGRQSLLAMAAMILGVIAASRAGSADGVNAAIVGSQAAVIQGTLNYTRDMEREADRIGYALFSGAGFAPGGMAGMFEKLEAASRLNDNQAFPYLRTHPLTTERIGEARARITGAQAAAALNGARFEHAVMRGRARVLMDTRDESLKRAQLQAREMAADAAAADRVGLLAASAQASLLLRDAPRALRDLDTAQALLAGAVSDGRAARALKLMQLQVLAERADIERAQAVLRTLADDGSRPVLLARAQLALAAAPGDGARRDELKLAAEDLQTWVATRAQDALAWDLLSQAWTRLDQPLRAVRAQAESRYALGDLAGAADRLRAGQQLARGPGARSTEFIEASVIDARLREVEAQRRQLAEQLRREGRNPAE